MYGLKDLNNFSLITSESILLKKLLQLAFAHGNQGLLRPLTKPIQSTTINQRGKHSQPGRKRLTNRTHRNDNVNVLFYS